MPNTNYSSDVPVHNQESDLFGRWHFSERVAQVIARRSDPSSIVIGLYGKWGDGKTSVLNFIESSLESNDDVICIKFNPWRFGTEEQLLMEFFNSIAEALDSKLETREDKLKDTFMKVMKPIASVTKGTSVVSEVVESFISLPDINEFKKRTEQLLEDNKKRVLILIDDVDRLDKSEIHALFRLVKLTADFKYTSYVLAFDKHIIASSLQDRYSTADTSSGEAFLEKIIQIPLNLPLVEQETLRQFCFDGINEALKIAETNLDQEEVRRFVQAYNSAFDNYLDTPRKAKLYGNILMFSLPILKGEVNTVDLMLIEGIRVFYPELYKVIRNNKSSFTGSFSSSYPKSNELEKEQTKNLIAGALGEVESSKKNGLIDLLNDLFPKLQSVYGNMGFGADYYQIWNKEQRICSSNYFSRYFTYSVSKNDIPDLEIKEILEKLTHWDCSYDSNSLTGILKNRKPDTLITKLRSKYDDIQVQTAKNLAIALCQVSAQFTKLEGAMWNDAFTQSAMLLSDLFQVVKKDGRVAVIKQSLDAITDLEYKIEVFRWLRHEKADNPVDNSLTSEQMDEIGKFLAEQIVAVIESLDTNCIEVSFANFLWIIEKYYNSSYIESFLSNRINDRYFILRLLKDFTPTWTAMESGKSGKGDFAQEQYSSLTKYIDASVINDAINHVFADELVIPDNYPTKDDNSNDDPLVYVKQFKWLYRNELSSKGKQLDSDSDGG
ncbi:KAP family P-loop NTPase fold protein [Psychrobacter piechaudii]|uniref:KAP family P-loop domain protein n=1 Tax=Psychrobacter piechaudii TaxID=1945521 RepID=A0A1R4GYB5_9GAMM|nr:P-loop NTPase fold protein [Psychrobacter piechaudii]SJM73134.1 KAP family P-loop domain protein [Psychrobacter piechaudii]